MGQDLVLGIDGGATKTEWALAIEGPGSRLVQASGGTIPGANLRLISDATLRDLLAQMPAHASRIGLCLAGCSTESDRQRVDEIARPIWPHAKLHIGSDRDSALCGALGADDGVVVIAGTGSAVQGRRGDVTEKAGGRGHLLGDKGGAYQLSLEALRSVITTHDLGNELGPFAKALLQHLDMKTFEDLVPWAHKATKSDIAALCPLVFEACESHNDESMREILEQGAAALARNAHAVARKLGLERPRIVLTGGLFRNRLLYENLFRKKMNSSDRHEPPIGVSSTSEALGAARFALSSSEYPSKPSHGGESLPPTELWNPALERADEMSTPELLSAFIEDEREVHRALNSQLASLSACVDLVATVLRGGGRLLYVGAGTSGRLGALDASEIPPTFGETPERVQGLMAGGARAFSSSVEGAEDDVEAAIEDIRRCETGSLDVVCGITASGRTPYVLAALEEARKLGARTILLTCNPNRDRSYPRAEVEVDLPTGPELVAGSTRLKAGTATKVALNILTTCSMIKLGKVERGFMIDFQPANAKLRERALRFVSRLRSCSKEEASRLLTLHDWSVRRALRQ